MVISVSLDMFSPQLTQRIIDNVIVAGQLSQLKWLLLGILAVGVGRTIFQYTKEYLFDRTSSKIAADMRMRLFNHIQSLSADYFDKTNTGELMARVKDDVDRIWDGLNFVSMLLIEVVLHTAIVLVCMFSLNAWLTIIPLKLYFNGRGLAKVDVALARGKKLHDKRQTERERDWNREKSRLLRDRG